MDPSPASLAFIIIATLGVAARRKPRTGCLPDRIGCPALNWDSHVLESLVRSSADPGTHVLHTVGLVLPLWSGRWGGSSLEAEEKKSKDFVSCLDQGGPGRIEYAVVETDTDCTDSVTVTELMGTGYIGFGKVNSGSGVVVQRGMD